MLLRPERASVFKRPGKENMCLKHRNSATGGVLGMTDPASAGYSPSAAVAKSSVGYGTLQHASHARPSYSPASGGLGHDFLEHFLVYFTFAECQNEAETSRVLQKLDKASGMRILLG